MALYTWLEESDENKRTYANMRDVEALMAARHYHTLEKRSTGKWLLATVACAVITFSVWSLYTLWGSTSETETTGIHMGNEIRLVSADRNYAIDADHTDSISVVEQEQLFRQVQAGKSETNRLIVPDGKLFSIRLSDGTIVRLNSMSELHFPSEFTKGERVVELTGEAFFDVSHDPQHPFIVKTGNSCIRVLGTRFNVSAYPDYGQEAISLVEGSVEAIAADKTMRIRPGEQIKVIPRTGQMEKGEFNPEEVMAWMNGTFFFEDQPLAYVLKALERWYSVKFEFASESLKDIPVYIRISKEKSVEDLFRALEATRKISFRQEEGRVVVESNE